jgi:hypothetical protein
MKRIIPFLILTVGLILMFLCEDKLNISSPIVYWFLGSISTGLALVVDHHLNPAEGNCNA